MEHDQLHNDVVKENLNRVLAQGPSIFRNFQPEELHSFIQLGIVERYSRNELIIDEIEPSNDTAFLILDGKVAISKDSVHMGVLGEGHFLEEIFLFGKGSRIASLTAQEPCMLLKFSRSSVLDFFRTKPERIFTIFIVNILEIQQRRIAQLMHTLVRTHKHLESHDLRR